MLLNQHGIQLARHPASQIPSASGTTRPLYRSGTLPCGCVPTSKHFCVTYISSTNMLLQSHSSLIQRLPPAPDPPAPPPKPSSDGKDPKCPCCPMPDPDPPPPPRPYCCCGCCTAAPVGNPGGRRLLGAALCSAVLPPATATCPPATATKFGDEPVCLPRLTGPTLLPLLLTPPPALLPAPVPPPPVTAPETAPGSTPARGLRVRCEEGPERCWLTMRWARETAARRDACTSSKWGRHAAAVRSSHAATCMSSA